MTKNVRTPSAAWVALFVASCGGGDPSSEDEDGGAQADHATQDARPPRFDASGARDATTSDAGSPSHDASAALDLGPDMRAPCCAIDGGAPPPTEPLEGCVSALFAEPAAPPPDVCADDGAGVVTSSSSALKRKLIAGNSYRFSYTWLQSISGDPIIVDVFGSQRPCERTEYLFSLTLDGRLYQEYCFVPEHDVSYTVTRVQVGAINFNYTFGDAIVDTCTEACTP